MLRSRPYKTLALFLLVLYLPLVASLDLWHHHGAENGHGASCAACHFAASHAPIQESVALILETATAAGESEPFTYVFDIVRAENSRAPPSVLSSFVVTHNHTMRKDTRNERNPDWLAAAGSKHLLCA